MEEDGVSPDTDSWEIRTVEKQKRKEVDKG